MAQTVQSLQVYGKYLINVKDESAFHQLTDILGFTLQGNELIAPAAFRGEYLINTPMPRNLEKWPVNFYEIYADSKGTLHTFLALDYSDDLEIRYGKYDYKLTNKFYGVDKQKTIYDQYATAKIDAIEDWVKFPFKTWITSDFKSQDLREQLFFIQIINDVHREQKALNKLITSTLVKTDERKEKLERIQDVFAMGGRAGLVSKTVKPAKGDNLAFETTTILATSWRDVILFELERDIKAGIVSNKCRQCGGSILIGDNGDADRQYHTKAENLFCFKQHNNARQIKLRAKIKKL